MTDSQGILVGIVASGSIVTGFLWRIVVYMRKINNVMEKFMIEHEILISDYCRRTGIKAEDLPTRLKGLLKSA